MEGAEPRKINGILLATLAGALLGVTFLHASALVADAIIRDIPVAPHLAAGYGLQGLGLLVFHALMGAFLGAITGLVTRRVYERRIEQEHESTILQQQLLQSQKMESIGRLTSGVAHDFNNLLSALNLHLHLAKMNVDEGHDGRRAIDQAARVAKKAGHLPRQLLAIARPQDGGRKVIDPVRLVHDMGKMLHRALGDDVVLKTDLEETKAILADPGQMEQILLNLCVNARDAMPDGGTLTIRVRQDGEEAVLQVEDKGTGMDEETLAKIFDPFFTTKAQGHGTGLGLSTSKSIVQQHGGRMVVDSHPGQGTTFTIRFPTVDELPEEDAAEEEPLPVGKHEGVLVVDDEDEVREAIALALRSHGYRVWDAKTGRSALAILGAEDGEIQCVLTDALMPGMSGNELAEAVRSTHPGTPVLMMGAFTERVDHVPFVEKPIEAAELAREVRQQLDTLTP